ncbi:MAG: molybdate ABC transporter substrate-binding protein [Bacteroidales bacterium]|nr:molybdate ABC transporter substrate-binding protein [Bacteroidales bacterium]MBN2818714.1 molybdate ABC transporter substrate-binding protein [Bacteroidales bacterium]
MKNLVFKIKMLIGLIALVLLLSCQNDKSKNDTSEQEPVLIYAAASLTDVITEIVDSFQVKYKLNIKVNFASSGTLAMQIQQGGSPDIFISASKKWADYVDSMGYILPGQKTEVANNVLVLIAPKTSKQNILKIDSTLKLLPLLDDGRLSVGDPAHVPAGKYAKQALEYYDWYKDLESKLLPAKDVRSALMVVELQETPLGIVFKTDALKSEKVKVLAYFPEFSHTPIIYLAGVCSEKEEAREFMNFLKSDETIALWKKYGFEK